MSDQTDNAAADLAKSLISVVDNVKQFETLLHNLFRSLADKGVQVNFNMTRAFKVLYKGLERSATQAGEITRQLEQLQGVVRDSALIVTSLELDQVLQEVMDYVISLTGAERAYMVLREHHSGELKIRAARNWDHETLSDDDVVISRSVLSAALNEGTPIITTNAQADERFQAVESVLQFGLRSILCIPLILRGQTVGALYADNRIQQGIFHADRIPLLTAFATQAASAIEKARLHQEEVKQQRLEEELAVGQKIQLGLLPKSTPSVPGWEFAAAYQPARTVGGDFYDFFDFSGGLGIVIADVADKGIPAALFMALSRTMIRTTALTGCTPSEALIQANALILHDNDSDTFLSAFYAALDTTSGRLIYANAGHNRPLWWRAAQSQTKDLVAKGIVLGLFETINLEEREVQIEPGDILVFYTDGITEAMDMNSQEFGEAHLRATISAYPHASAQEILDAIVGVVKDFIGDAPQSDDFTLVVVKRQN